MGTMICTSLFAVTKYSFFIFFFFKGSGAHRYLPSFPTRRSPDLGVVALGEMGEHEQPRPAPQCAKGRAGMCLLPSPQYCGDGRRVLLLGWRSLAGAAADRHQIGRAHV